jgi:hypothetical protein
MALRHRLAAILPFRGARGISERLASVQQLVVTCCHALRFESLNTANLDRGIGTVKSGRVKIPIFPITTIGGGTGISSETAKAREVRTVALPRSRVERGAPKNTWHESWKALRARWGNRMVIDRFA